MRRVLVLAVTVSIVAACTPQTEEQETTTTEPIASTTSSVSTTTSSTATTTTTTVAEPLVSHALPKRLPAFAQVVDVPLLEDEPAYAGPAHPDNLDEVFMVGWIDATLSESPEMAERLHTDGFVIRPGFNRLFHQAYESAVYEGHPVFVTTDAAYHVWHLAFSKVLRETEEAVLLPVLEVFLADALASARAQSDALASTSVADAANRVAQYFEAAATLAGLDPGAIGPRAAAEVDLAREHAQLTESPVTSFEPCNPLVSPAGCVDYGLYRPRGHYTRNADLERYFTAMSMLGQAAFFVAKTGPTVSPTIDTDSLRVGLLAARAVAAAPEAVDAWETLYEPTAFLVGVADDFTPFELAEVADTVVPGWSTDPSVLTDAMITDIGNALLELRDVAINPEAASVRLMGARFVLDSYLLDQLAWPNVGTEKDRRVYVSPLDVATLFGSDLARQIQEETGEFEFDGYEAGLARLQGELDARGPSDWAGTVYDAWLHALEPVWVPYGAAYPDYMQTAAWAAKSLQTGLGSYAELKHDTILYAKQGFAAEAGGEAPPIPPRHWVEPNPVAFGRLSAAAGLLERGLTDRGLLGEEQASLVSDVRSFLDRLERIARDELAGEPISEDDNQWLESIGAQLELLWLRSSDIDEDLSLPSAADQDAALIADIFRTSFHVLEIGTGRVDDIFVLVPDDLGRFQVAVGGVYSYYEFWGDPARRLTDEEWRAMIESGEIPDRTDPLVLPDERERPAWQAVFLAE